MTMSNRFIKSIPNTITTLNIVAGSVSIAMAFEGQLFLSVVFVFLAALFDFMDGMAARLLNAYSEIGKQLDSLADIVSFGIAPAAFLFSVLKIILFGSQEIPQIDTIELMDFIILITPVFVPVLSAIRLAKFNIDKRQTESFLGLAVPANAIFLVSLYFIFNQSNLVSSFLISHTWIIAFIIVGFSLLLVTEIPMFSMKVKNLNWKNNEIRYIFLIISVFLLLTLKAFAVPLIIVLYILISLINNLITKH